MRKFRIHNDIPITWRIVDKQTLLPFDLDGKTVRLSLQTRFGMISIEDFTVAGNVISFVFKASQQSTLGVYTATASITDAEGHTWTMDACQMLELVAQSCCADVCGSHGVDGTSGVEFQQVIFVDSELNAESKNPVSNSAVTKAIQGIMSNAFATDEKINREIEERKAENNVLSLRINQEEAERKASDNSLSERIDSSVDSLESLILDEGKAREESDNALLEKINQETDERKESESSLYGRIEEESNQRKEAYNALDGKISEEIEARKAADSAIGDRINTLSDKAVQTTPQNFSEEQKSQARENIGAPSKVGYYSKMSVGFSENISGDGSAVPAEFTFRPTAGENRNILNDGSARIKSIKGNSLVWNQQIKTALSQTDYGANGWWCRQGSDKITLDGRKVSYTVISSASSNNQISQKVPIKKDHKYLIHFWYDTHGVINDNYGRACRVLFSMDKDGGIAQNFFTEKNNITTDTVNLFVTADSDYEYIILKEWYVIGNKEVVEHIMDFADIQLIDLTQMFGSGNEPATIEEFYAHIPSNIDMYAYNEGEIINNNVEGIKTVGFNQWDEQWELGNISTLIGVNETASNSIRSKDYIPIIGGQSYYFYKGDGGEMGVFAYDSNYNFIGVYTKNTFTSSVGTSNITNKSIALPSNARYIKFRVFPIASPTYNNDICINLSWPEYEHLNGTYQPYKPFSLDLSWVKKYFPEGMRSAGSKRDEIRFNHSTQKWEAVQNVGVRAYESGDESDSTVTTDGSNTNYAVATPVVTEITEDVNLDYDCSDYGTEQILSDVPSVPISADIVYQPNALATIKNVPDLMARISALEQALDSLQSTQVEEKVIE